MDPTLFIDDLVEGLIAEVQPSLAYLRDDFPAFCEYIYNRPLKDYQRDLALILQNSDHDAEILIEAPPGHAKSTITANLYPAWRIGKNHNTRVQLSTHTISFAEIHIAQIEKVMLSPEFLEVFGNIVPQSGDLTWNRTMKFIKRTDTRLKDPTLFALGVGSATLGYRCDLSIADDLVTKSNSMTETMRKNVSRWYWGSLYTRLDPGASMIVDGARFYYDDLYSEIEEEFKGDCLHIYDNTTRTFVARAVR